MPSIEEEIANWLNQRPDLIRLLAARILEVGSIDDAFVESHAADLIAGTKPHSPTSLTATDLPTSASTGARVELLSIRDVKNVNALADGGTLSFGDSGLTVIYGDNGSGKSGFARLVKDAVGARHHQAILPNAFDPSAPKDQSAVIEYRVNGEDRALTWPEGVDVNLRQVHFYDEACGDHYLVNDTELSYRPSALALLDRLVEGTDRLRGALEKQLAKVGSKRYEVPGLLPSTEAGRFAAALSENTSDEEIDAAVELPQDPDATLVDLVREESRLQATNPANEKARLVRTAEALKLMAGHIDTLRNGLCPDASSKLEALHSEARDLRAAAELASKTSFANEPLRGVGSKTWRTLWQAAEAYSLQEAYHEHSFPYVGEDSRCPLCQQEIGADASSRLQRFHAFVRDQTAKRAQAAEDSAKHAINEVIQLEVATVATTQALATIESQNKAVADDLRSALEVADSAKARIGARLRGDTDEPPVAFPTVDTDALRVRSGELHQHAEQIDAAAFATQLRTATEARNELKAKIELARHAENLKKDAARQRAVANITAIRNGISTQPITVQSVALTRKYVNERVNDRFSREPDRLGLEHVKLDDKGGGKGQLRHKPALLGATLATKSVRDVLSEGEQTALGLAGLLTEINFDDSSSAFVLDDPITSLDHGRREKVAKRIAGVACSRQVIVFTHDLTFLGDLIRAAEEEGIKLLERSIVRGSKGVSGVVLETHPWKAKDAKKRIDALRQDLAKIKKDRPALSQDEYGDRVQLWAGKLSEVWERIVRNDVAGKVVDRGTTEVHPKMMRLLARITDADNTDFQAGYSQVSKWAPRHDKSEEVNFVAPDVVELEAELDRAQAWLKRITSYAQS